MKKLFTIALLLPVVLAFAGIYRDDRDKQQYISLAHQPQFNCVGQVQFGYDQRASCVLIGSRWALSAAHVFAGNNATDSIHYYCTFNGLEHRCTKIIKYPGADNDIAMLLLDHPVTGITPAHPHEQHNELHADVTGVGYGNIYRADNPPGSRDKPEKFAGENVVDTAAGSLVQGVPSVLYCDFDCPKDSKYFGQCNKMGSPLPRNLEYFTDAGDSGGGLFMHTATGWELVGICASAGVNMDQYSKTFYYGQIMGWTRVSAFTSWIKECERKEK